MRRRFEKRVYIALPEAPARSSMFKLNLGDTPNSLTEADFHELGEMADGYSGSDVAVRFILYFFSFLLLYIYWYLFCYYYNDYDVCSTMLYTRVAIICILLYIIYIPSLFSIKITITTPSYHYYPLLLLLTLLLLLLGGGA